MTAATDHAGAIAAHGLPGAPSIPPAPVDAEAWTGLVRVLTVERLLPVASYAAAEGAFAVSDEQRAELVAGHERAMSLALVLERCLLDAVSHLEHAGIDVRALRGPAVARLEYPDPSWRAFGDVDLLVPGARFDDAGRVLAERGHRIIEPDEVVVDYLHEIGIPVMDGPSADLTVTLSPNFRSLNFQPLC